MMKLNIECIWLIFVLGVGNLWIVDGYKCEFEKYEIVSEIYICKVVPDSSENVENHISGKTDDDVEKFIFDARFHNITHFTQSESAPFCQRFKDIKEMEIKGYKLSSIDANSFRNCKEIKKIEIHSTNIQEFPENLFSENSKLTRLWISSNNLTTLPENIFANQMELESLSFSHNPFTFLPPNIFKPLRRLKWFYLTGTNLRINPKWFKNLKNLDYLDLSDNNILDLPKYIFCSFESLFILKLSENQLKVIHSDSFGTLQRISLIRLDQNNIYAIDEKLIDNINLRWLDMEKNNCSNVSIGIRDGLKEKFTPCFNNYQPRQEEEYYKCKFHQIDGHEYTCGVVGIGNIEQHEMNKADKDVKVVKFDGNSDTISNLNQSMFPVCQRFHNLEEIQIKWVKSVDEDFLEFCDDLKVYQEEVSDNLLKENSMMTKLNIKGSKLTTLPENIFIKQQELVELHLHQNQISSLPDKIFNPLKKLRYLWLQGNKIQSLNSKFFEKLSNLATLDLSHNHIEDLPKDVFSSLTGLEKLMLNFNQLTIIKSESFGSLQKLTQLNLYENKIDAIDEKLIDNTGISMIDMEGNICSQEEIQDRDEIKESLTECFENYKSIYNFECGKSKIVFNETIFNGDRVKHGQYPWSAALIRKTGQFFCGATLISNKLVLTAAHCIKGKQDQYSFTNDDFVVTLGAQSLSETNEPGRITIKLKSIDVHPDWNTDTYSYDADIALLELEEKVEFSEYIQPICIAKPETEPALKTLGNVVGRGGNRKAWNFDIARLLSTPIHSYKKCLENHEFLDLMSARTFCGGYANGTGVCTGDNGGGLTVDHEGIHYLRGIVSASLVNVYGECDQNRYSVFTDVLRFYGWITNRTEYRNLLFNSGVDDENQLSSTVGHKWNLVENNNHKCGKVIVPHGLIFYGDQVSHGQHPWNAALMLNDIGIN